MNIKNKKSKKNWKQKGYRKEARSKDRWKKANKLPVKRGALYYIFDDKSKKYVRGDNIYFPQFTTSLRLATQYEPDPMFRFFTDTISSRKLKGAFRPIRVKNTRNFLSTLPNFKDKAVSGKINL